MVQPVKMRQSDPVVVQKLWSAILFIRAQKQIPNNDRVLRYMIREHDLNEDEVQTQLQYAVSDELVAAYLTVSCKGANTGVEQEGYRMPEAGPDCEKGSHDWYCFDCHKPGEVLQCDDCWRVYHPDCTEESWDTSSKFVCTICLLTKKKPHIKRKELNKLLCYTVARLKDKTRELHRFGGNEQDDLMIQRFVFKYIDLNEMEAKVGAAEYRYIGEFFSDARLLLHNTFFCYGDSCAMAELAKIMIRDCKYDLDEIQQCKDCYYNSNAKPKDWFCQPCDPPHELVYAKQKGFTFWPAKVIKITQEGYDVRFFGGWHQRAIIAEVNIRPIDLNVRQLGGKRTAGSTRAVGELQLHQELLSCLPAKTTSDHDEEPEQGPLKDDDTVEPAPEAASPVASPPAPEPRIRHKKFRKRQKLEEREEREGREGREGTEETSAEVITSSNVSPEKSAPTPEDTNMVTSSQDNVLCPRIISTTDTGVQTSRKLLHGRHLHKLSQTEAVAAPPVVAPVACDCGSKYTKIFGDFKERLANDHCKDKERGLKELEERLRKDFEDDKQAAVGRAVANVQRETERVRRQTEERCREQYMEEMRKLSAKHKTDISAAKKKQWCYNCEEEAMYHCCWNTSYCSIKCQQEHWHREHKRMCRRKRT